MCEAQVYREIYKTKMKESEFSEVVVLYQIFHRLDICMYITGCVLYIYIFFCVQSLVERYNRDIDKGGRDLGSLSLVD